MTGDVRWGTSSHTQARDVEQLADRALTDMVCPGCAKWSPDNNATIYRTRIEVTCSKCGLVFAFGAGQLRLYLSRSHR